MTNPCVDVSIQLRSVAVALQGISVSLCETSKFYNRDTESDYVLPSLGSCSAGLWEHKCWAETGLEGK